MVQQRSRPIARNVGRLTRTQLYTKRGLFKGQKKAAAPAKEATEEFKTKKVGGSKNGGERKVPTVKARAFYPAEDVAIPKNSRKTQRPTKLRESITPGTVLILLAGRFRGKRVVFLKQLDSGLLLVTGPFKVNGVPLRRVNQAYVIATSTKINVGAVESSKVNDAFFAKAAVKNASKEEAFFGDKAEKKEYPAEKAQEQKNVDKAILAEIKKVDGLTKYLNASFGLSRGEFPHEVSPSLFYSILLTNFSSNSKRSPSLIVSMSIERADEQMEILEDNNPESIVYDSSSPQSTSTSSLTWISWFCSLPGHEYFAEVSEDFIEDEFNLTGLAGIVGFYKEALEMILDVEPEESLKIPDVSIVEHSAEMLYGLIHARYILTRIGLQQMVEKYENGHFGFCPRFCCQSCPVVPCGRSDTPGVDTVKLYCPNCMDIYVPPSSRFQGVDGSFFGTTFPHLLFHTFKDLQPSIVLSENENGVDYKAVVGSQYKPAATKIYTPKIYGFKISEKSRSGPRMQWLRMRPNTVEELNSVDNKGNIKNSDLKKSSDRKSSNKSKQQGKLFDEDDDDEEIHSESEEEEDKPKPQPIHP
ncbi:hypothetical protein E3Q23_00343 [Wallemia mellicola]|uniref:Multifunctional fusion protein n=1 Tax=Wallemia mellicola TaxID=1708541 RepID=A0A4T0TUS9_9BASI|nr:hypothetical protein E3Q23_00343 [Wallemia mellicola]TIC68980.1 hypothetical protein E3Q01_00660 [Wallemia mellicola]